MRTYVSVDHRTTAPYAKVGSLGRPVLVLDENAEVLLELNAASLEWLRHARAAIDQLITPLARDLEERDDS